VYKVIPIFAATMDANKNPNVPATVNQNSSSAVDTGIELVNTVVAIVKEVSEMLNGVPYVKSLSGVILQIIRVRDVSCHRLLLCMPFDIAMCCI
jgi:hypothetical protein